jgi:hypothetical protein
MFWLLTSLIVVLGAAAIFSFRTRVRLVREAQRNRPTKAEFLLLASARGISSEVSGAVYAGFQKWASAIIQDFRVSPIDRVALFMPIVAYDYEVIMNEILAAAGRIWPKSTPLPYTKKMTIIEMATIIEEKTKHQ